MEIYSTQMKPPSRWLTDDETMSIRSKHGEDLEFRVRIWRGAKATAIVLVGPRTNGDGLISVPSIYSEKIANFVLSGILRHPEHGILYYDYDPPFGNNDPALHQVHFDHFGNEHRARLTNPISRTAKWATLERDLGQGIDR